MNKFDRARLPAQLSRSNASAARAGDRIRALQELCATDLRGGSPAWRTWRLGRRPAGVGVPRTVLHPRALRRSQRRRHGYMQQHLQRSRTGRGAQGVAPQRHRHVPASNHLARERGSARLCRRSRRRPPAVCRRPRAPNMLDVDLEVADQVARLAAGAGQWFSVAAEGAHQPRPRTGPVASFQVRAVGTQATTLLPR